MNIIMVNSSCHGQYIVCDHNLPNVYKSLCHIVLQILVQETRTLKFRNEIENDRYTGMYSIDWRDTEPLSVDHLIYVIRYLS